MTDDSCWVYTWIIIASTVIAIAICSVWYWADYNEKVVRLVEAGVDPVAAICAMQNDYGRNPVCIVLATKEQGNRR